MTSIRALPLNIVTFWGTGVRTSKYEFWGDTIQANTMPHISKNTWSKKWKNSREKYIILVGDYTSIPVLFQKLIKLDKKKSLKTMMSWKISSTFWPISFIGHILNNYILFTSSVCEKSKLLLKIKFKLALLLIKSLHRNVGPGWN